MKFSYSVFLTPDDYICQSCKISGVKLWRDYNGFQPTQSLRCADCAQKEQNRILNWNECDQIGWMVPAIPSEDGIEYWGYTSVPSSGCRWWHNLEPKSDQHEYPADTNKWVAKLYSNYLLNKQYGKYVASLCFKEFYYELVKYNLEFLRRSNGCYRFKGRTFKNKKFVLAFLEKILNEKE